MIDTMVEGLHICGAAMIASCMIDTMVKGLHICGAAQFHINSCIKNSARAR